jgi:hypothetical protein
MVCMCVCVCVCVHLVGVHVEVLGYALVLGQESVCKPTTKLLYNTSGVTVVSQWCYRGRKVNKTTTELLCKSRGESDAYNVPVV